MDKEQVTSVIGLRLSEARAVLESQDETCALPIRVVETAPPARSPRPARQSPSAASAPDIAPSREAKQSKEHDVKYWPVQWGEWRVLRCRICCPEHGEAFTELLVAREELGTEEFTQQN